MLCGQNLTMERYVSYFTVKYCNIAPPCASSLPLFHESCISVHHQLSALPSLLLVQKKIVVSKYAIQECKTDTVYMPAGCNSLHLAGIYWKKPSKASLWRTWMAFVRNSKKTPKGNLLRSSWKDMVDLAAAAWAAVPEETTGYSFK